MSHLNHAGNEYAARLAANSRTPESQKVAAKMYFHQFNYAKFHFDLGGSNCKSVQFANYRYITDDKREQDQLDLVADAPGTYIYTIPDSDVAHALAQEANQESARSIMQAAAAAAAVNGHMFDPNVPIIPVNVQPVHQTPNMQVAIVPQQLQTTVGIQHSLSGTAGIEPVGANPTSAASQTRAPSAADEAMARLRMMTAEAQKKSDSTPPAA